MKLGNPSSNTSRAGTTTEGFMEVFSI
jgi:hypothetical protein